jgi:3-oxoacyl-[acyl-carrier protein] reductase
MNVLVTGSSKGLGASIIEEFASHNYNVIINYNKDLEEANNLVKKLNNKEIDIRVIKCDISNEEDVKEMFSKIDHLDVLINNAGISIDNELKDKSSLEFNKVLNTNLTGTFLVTKYAIDKMTKGSIVNISSTNAIDTFYMESIDYDASKAGVISLTHNFANYLKDIRVNCICPDWINTDMNKDMDADYKKQIKFLEPKEVAELVYKVATNPKLNDRVIRISGDKK